MELEKSEHVTNDKSMVDSFKSLTVSCNGTTIRCVHNPKLQLTKSMRVASPISERNPLLRRSNLTKLIFGTGMYSYEVIQPFGVLPHGIEFGETSHVALDSKDRIYLTQRYGIPILVFDAKGNFLTGLGEGQILDAHGIFINDKDEIFLVDRDAHEILMLDTEGNILLRIGSRGKPSSQAPFNHPCDVAVAPSGDIFVADGYGNSSVHRFSPEGKHLKSWGKPGKEPTQLTAPLGIWVDFQNRVYVSDWENSKVKIFSPEGDPIDEWLDLYHPMDIFIDNNGIAYVTDQTPRFTVLDRNGEVLSRGKAPDVGRGIWGDSQGNLYLTGDFPGAAGSFKGMVKFQKQ